MTLQPQCPQCVYRERRIHPSLQGAGITRLQIVAAGQHSEWRADGDRTLDHLIRQRSTRVTRDHDIVGRQFDGLQRGGFVLDAAAQSRPGLDYRFMHGNRRRGDRRVHHDRHRRCVIEQQHQLRNEAVAASKVDDPAAAEKPARAPREFPGLVEFFSRQAFRFADGPADAIKQGTGGEPAQVVSGQPRP